MYVSFVRALRPIDPRCNIISYIRPRDDVGATGTGAMSAMLWRSLAGRLCLCLPKSFGAIDGVSQSYWQTEPSSYRS